MESACHAELERLIEWALREDLGETGDVTGQAIAPEKIVTASIIAKNEGIVCGTDAVRLTFSRLDPQVRVRLFHQDGDRVTRSSKIAEVMGPADSLLAGERVALNFLQRLSGIATLTSRFVEQLAGTGATLLDTRKTTPGWRHLEKYAVRCGGGRNHRQGLFDMFLIKENHIAAAGSIGAAVDRCRMYGNKIGRRLLIEVETRSLEEVEQAVRAGADRIMLDNMPAEEMKAAVELVAQRVAVEVSGNVTLQNVAAIAALGVDFISSGAITHSAPAMDYSMLSNEPVNGAASR